LSLLICSLCVFTTLARPALAEPTAADRATARALAREGFEALKKDDFVTAEDSFRRADELVHAPTLVVDHARALVGLGRLVEAHERYSLVLREGVSPNAAWPWKRAYADAQKEIEVIKQRLAWLTIEVVGPTQPEVSVDGKPIPGAAVGVRRATDPGERRIKGGGQGYYPKEESVILTEGDEQTLRLELEAKPPEVLAQEAPPEAAPAAAQSQTQQAAPAPAPPEQKDNTLAYVALGVGGAGLAAWAVTGIIFLQSRSKLNKECFNTDCQPEMQDEVDKYETMGIVSGAAFVVGAAGTAVGVTLLLTGDSDSETAKASGTSVTPYFAGNSVGVVGKF
jgi:hypothetical protein